MAKQEEKKAIQISPFRRLMDTERKRRKETKRLIRVKFIIVQGFRILKEKRNLSIPSLLEERKSSSTKITPPTPALTTKAPFQIRMNNDPIKIGRLYLSDNDYAIKPRLRCSLTTAVGVTIISIIDA